MGSLIQQLQQNQQGLDPDLQRAFSETTTGSLDLSSLTTRLTGLTQDGSSGPSFFDPTYLMISGALQLFGMGFLMYAKKQGSAASALYGLACFALSWDYTSWVCWAIAVAMVAAARLLFAD